MRYWRVRARKTRLISQTLYELSGVTYSVLSQVKMEPQIPEPINHHEGAHNLLTTVLAATPKNYESRIAITYAGSEPDLPFV